MPFPQMLRVLAAALLFCGLSLAAGDDDRDSSPAKPEPPKSDSRIFGVIPNNRSISLHGEKVEPLTVRDKFRLASATSFDPGAFVVTGTLAGIGQWHNQYPTFGQGMKGYGRRWGMMFTDNMASSFLSDAVFPSIFRQDPRYFRLGEGSTGKRIGYAISRVWLARCDNGKRCFNYGEVLGSAAHAGISSYYYPAAERTGSNIGARTTIAIAPDVVSNLLREFWPDIARKLKSRRKSKTP